MQILRVELENIKSYERAVIDFAPGVNAIMGHNGAGKSTVLEAIGFALFDSLPYKANEFLREGTRTGNVAVTFVGNLDERAYRIERRLGGSHQYVAYDVELQAKLCEGKVDVLAFVRQQAGADAGVDLSELFANAIGVQQGTLVAAFLLAPAQRKQLFDALLQVDDYKEAADKLREPRSLLQERTQILAQQGAILTGKLQRLPEIERAVQQRTVELLAIDESLAGLCARLEQIEAQKVQMDSVRLEIERCELQRMRQVERCATLNAQDAVAHRQVTEAEQAAHEVALHLTGHDQYVAAQQRKEELDQQVHTRQRLRQQQAAADKQLALAQSELARSEERLAAVADAEELIRRLAPAIRQQELIEQSLAELQKDRGRLQAAVKNNEAMLSDLQQMRGRGQALALQLAQAEQMQQEMQQAEQVVANLREQIAHCTGELATWQAAASNLKGQNDALESVVTAICPVCEQPLSEEHRRRMVERNLVRLQELRNEFAVSQKRMRQADAALQTAVAEQRQCNERLRSLPRPEELEEVHRRIEQLANSVHEATGAQAELVGLEQHFAGLNGELSALQNPRQQNAVAMQRASERGQVVALQADSIARRMAAQTQLAALEASLEPLAGLDAMLLDVSATLRSTHSAYQTVLANRKLAESVAQRVAAAEQAAAALAEAQTALAAAEQAAAAAQNQFDPVVYASISSEDQSLRNTVGGQQARKVLLIEDQHKDQAALRVLLDERDELAALSVRQAALSRQAAVLEAVRSLLRQSGPYITQALIRQISSGATRIFGELMQDFSRELQWQEDYGITVKTESGSRQFNQLSGGEQMSAALAVRLALVREISNIDIAFFDEPTANLDDVRREALAQQIMNVKGFRQLFVISHDDTFEQITQNLVRVKRHGSSSSVSPIEA